MDQSISSNEKVTKSDLLIQEKAITEKCLPASEIFLFFEMLGKTSHSHLRKKTGRQLSRGLCSEYKAISDIPQENIVNTKSSFCLFICSNLFKFVQKFIELIFLEI